VAAAVDILRGVAEGIGTVGEAIEGVVGVLGDIAQFVGHGSRVAEGVVVDDLRGQSPGVVLHGDGMSVGIGPVGWATHGIISNIPLVPHRIGLGGHESAGAVGIGLGSSIGQLGGGYLSKRVVGKGLCGSIGQRY